MNSFRITFCLLVLSASNFVGDFLGSLSAQQNPDSKISFRNEIQPLLARACFACHGPDANHRKADLRLDQEDSAKDHAIVPGDAAASELVSRIFSGDADEVMPPPESNQQLSDAERQLLKRWIEQGAAWQSHWAFEPIVSPDVPDVGGDWSKNEVDRFIFQALQHQKFTPSPPADKSTLLRRVTLDLTGLPPTPAERTAFLQDDSPAAFEKVVDRLLASSDYGEHMAVAWLDGARFADTNGFQNDFARHMWPWRDWVIDAFNQNLTYDDFILHQIAGDLLPSPTDAQLIATGFNRNNRSVTEAGSIAEEWRVENCVDRVETTSAVFLGLTMGCARCHDHKYDPISQQEFYEFFAFFNNVEDTGFYQESRSNSGPIFTFTTPEKEQELTKLAEEIKQLEQRLKLSEEAEAKQKQSDENAKQADQSAPAEGQPQATALDPSALEKPQSVAKKAPAEDKAQLAKHLKETRQNHQRVSNSRPTTMIMRERPPGSQETFLLKRGQYDQPDKERGILFASIPAALPPLADDQPQDRLGLARWMVDARNPLVARVAVNQMWMKFFGRGLVASADNFGVQGTPPTHPELLDWLASDFRNHGWDLKRLQKKIVMSAAYQQSSEHTAETLKQDPNNVWLARGPRYRLSAEQIRDQALAVSGLLVKKIGGPSVSPYQPAGLWEEMQGGGNSGPYRQSTGDDLYRRSLYTYRKRTVSHPTTATFGAPSWEICQVQRAMTNTPLQSLALLNDITYAEAARKLAERMLTEANPESVNASDEPASDEQANDEQEKMLAAIRFGFTLTHLREPNEAQLKTLQAGFDEYLAHYSKHPDDAQRLLKVGESKFNETIPADRLAAMTTVAAILLNLDEVISKE